MSRLRTALYLVTIVALLAAVGLSASPVQADDGGHHHGDDHKGDDHKKDKPGPDPTGSAADNRGHPDPVADRYPGTNRHSSASARSDGHVRTGTGDDTRGRAHGSARAGG